MKRGGRDRRTADVGSTCCWLDPVANDPHCEIGRAGDQTHARSGVLVPRRAATAGAKITRRAFVSPLLFG
jgi:hypothetical protein